MNTTKKYTAKKPFYIGYITLIGLGFLLTVGRWFSVAYNDFVIINAEIHSHISNLSLSLIVYLGIGYSWLLFGTKFRYIVILGVFLIVSNFVCETLMGFMNTTDIIDAVYGTIGITVSFIYLYITNKFGLIPACKTT